MHKRSSYLLLLPALLFAACGQPQLATAPTTTTAVSAPSQLKGVYQVSFQGVGSSDFTATAGAQAPAGLQSQGLVGVPEQFTFTLISSSTFSVKATQTRHVQATFKVTNNTGLSLDNLKLVPVVVTGSADGTPFTNVTHYDGSSAPGKAGSFIATQGQTFDSQRGQVTTDAGSSPFVTGLDVSGVDTTGLGISSIKTYGWQTAASLAPGASTNVTFAVDLPMDPAGPANDPFNFSLQFTPVQDGITLTSAVQQLNRTTKSFGNYTQFPTLTYSDNGQSVTHSLPAYYDLKNVDRTGATVASVLCSFDGAAVLNISDASHINRYRVEMQALGNHTLQVYPGTSCPASSGTPLLSQPVSGIAAHVAPLAAGGSSSLAVKSDGTVAAWGYLDTPTSPPSTSVPVPIPGLTNIVTAVTGSGFTLAVKSDGSVSGLGLNNAGQLGDGTHNPAAAPVTVSGISGVLQVATGSQHSLALKADGTVQSWGKNNNGQLGNGQNNDTGTAAPVPSLKDIVSISAMGYASLALMADGTLRAWGLNYFGQLGDGTNNDSSVPVQVQGITNAASISSGYAHSLAVLNDGRVKAWGTNNTGQLGNGTTVKSSQPVLVTGLSDATQVAGGSFHSLALKTDGTLLAWGDNAKGDLGDGTGILSTVPVNVKNMNGAVAVAAGTDYSLALYADGTMQAWGGNGSGQLGDGTTINRAAPVATFINGADQPTP